MFLKLIYLLWFRLEEKLSNSKLENQVLRQQALALSPTGKAVCETKEYDYSGITGIVIIYYNFLAL
jgi:hypothetical protein